MSKALLKRPASELPEKEGQYDTNLGYIFFEGGKWERVDGLSPKWWLDEQEVYTKEEVVKEQIDILNRFSRAFDGLHNKITETTHHKATKTTLSRIERFLDDFIAAFKAKTENQLKP